MADSPNRILGRATITVDGKLLATKPGAEIDPGGGERQPEMTDYGVAGWTEKSTAATLKVEVYAKAGITRSSLYAIKDATIVFVGDTGYTCTLVGATCAKPGSIKTGSGGAAYPCEFFGMIANETQS